MANLLVKTREGGETVIDGAVGRSVMQVIRDGGIDELMAICGGSCSCATCHVYVDEAFADRMPPISAIEADLLDASDHRRATSRLSCQIPFTEALGGLSVILAPED